MYIEKLNLNAKLLEKIYETYFEEHYYNEELTLEEVVDNIVNTLDEETIKNALEDNPEILNTKNESIINKITTFIYNNELDILKENLLEEIQME